jgi:hypothetical protein|tara:strand:+ start:184 stop:399 length:216 start_codon:yes stop_codon:yes gene_type:complete
VSKKLNLFSHRSAKSQRKPYRSMPIRKIVKNPKLTSKERYYRDKGVRIFNEESARIGEDKTNRTLHIRKNP